MIYGLAFWQLNARDTVMDLYSVLIIVPELLGELLDGCLPT